MTDAEKKKAEDLRTAATACLVLLMSHARELVTELAVTPPENVEAIARKAARMLAASHSDPAFRAHAARDLEL